MHRIFGAAGGRIDVRRSTANRVARRQQEASGNHNDDSNLLTHDHSLCLTSGTTMVVFTADCLEHERR
jgi:hypothetical protein